MIKNNNLLGNGLIKNNFKKKKVFATKGFRLTKNQVNCIKPQVISFLKERAASRRGIDNLTVFARFPQLKESTLINWIYTVKPMNVSLKQDRKFILTEISKLLINDKDLKNLVVYQKYPTISKWTLRLWIRNAKKSLSNFEKGPIDEVKIRQIPTSVDGIEELKKKILPSTRLVDNDSNMKKVVATKGHRMTKREVNYIKPLVIRYLKACVYSNRDIDNLTVFARFPKVKESTLIRWIYTVKPMNVSLKLRKFILIEIRNLLIENKDLKNIVVYQKYPAITKTNLRRWIHSAKKTIQY